MSEISKIQGKLEFLNNTVYVNQDGSNNLSFTDGITGTKTLAELASPGTIIFTGLTDTPNTYISNATKLLQVNAGENALEYVTNTLHIQNTDYQIYDDVTSSLSFNIAGQTGSGTSLDPDDNIINVEFDANYTKYVDTIQTIVSYFTNVEIFEDTISIYNTAITYGSLDVIEGVSTGYILNYPVQFTNTKTYKLVFTTNGSVVTAEFTNKADFYSQGTPYTFVPNYSLTWEQSGTQTLTDYTVLQTLRYSSSAKVLTGNSEVNIYGTALLFNGLPIQTDYSLPVADTGILGGILDGTDLSIDASGNVSVVNDSHTHSTQYLGLTAKATDSELLDNLNSTQFLRSDVDDTTSGDITISKTNGRLTFNETDYASGNSGLYFVTSANQNATLLHEISDGELPAAGQGLILKSTTNPSNPCHFQIDGDFYSNTNIVWHAGNFGKTQIDALNVDADTVDGKHASDLAQLSAINIFTNEYPLALTHTTPHILFEGSTLSTALSSINRNDGGGNFNIRTHNYYNSGEKYTTNNAGATHIELGSDTTDGTIRFEVAVEGTAGNTVSWAKYVELTTTNFTVDGNTVWHAGNDGSSSTLYAGIAKLIYVNSYTGTTVMRILGSHQTGGSDNVYSSAGVTVNMSTNKISAADYLLTSDGRLKENISPLEDTIDGLDPKAYNFIGQEDTRYGFIAQDVLKTHPHLVIGTGEKITETDEESGEVTSRIDYYSISEIGIIPILVKEVQILKKKNKKSKRKYKKLIKILNKHGIR